MVSSEEDTNEGWFGFISSVGGHCVFVNCVVLTSTNIQTGHKKQVFAAI